MQEKTENISDNHNQAELNIERVSFSFSIQRINDLTAEIKKKGSYINLLSLREDYAINLASQFGGFSWDYMPNGRRNES